MRFCLDIILYQKMHGQTILFFISDQFLFEEIWWLKDLSKSNVQFVLETFYCIERIPKNVHLSKNVDMASNLIDRLICVTFLSKSDFLDLISYFYCETIFCSLCAPTTTKSLNDAQHLIRRNVLFYVKTKKVWE